MARKKIDRKDKKCHREFVWLANSEYEHLIQLLGKDETEKWIDELNLYLGSKGDKYESHYYTIQCWARRAGKTTEPLAANRAVDQVIKLLKDHTAYMPEDPKIRPALHAMLIAHKLNWPRLRELLKENPAREARIREEFLKVYQH